jgi:alkanesulfonate monooxygenase SsuD/methylene tetrahydromethanopterin reductase-like flavin-dependent oxidoreductase (luciferase family)
MHHTEMRFSINIPNFGEFADARTVATVAVAAEQAGWDALFVWDHVVHDKRQRRGQPFGDPWMLLTAGALATSRLRLGTLVTPVARRRPEQLARQVATLDSLSDGRVIFGAGLGGPLEDEFASFGETTDPVVLAERLDEGLALLNRYWSGEPVDHHGRHYRVRDVTLLPASVQRPRPPVWIGGFWPHRRPIRRAAGWDGVVPLFTTARHGHAPPVDQVRDLVAYVHQHRADRPDAAFEIVLGGASPGDPAKARELIEPLAEVGATWWDERQLQTGSEPAERTNPVAVQPMAEVGVDITAEQRSRRVRGVLVAMFAAAGSPAGWPRDGSRARSVRPVPGRRRGRVRGVRRYARVTGTPLWRARRSCWSARCPGCPGRPARRCARPRYRIGCSAG